MASSGASGFIVTAEHEVTCPVCFDFFVDPNIPKVLECPHTCCQVCLQGIVILNQPGQPITCPMQCEKKTPVPAGGVTALKTNLQLQNLAQQHPNYTKGPRRTVPKCALHEDENTNLFCSPCNKLVCQNCIISFHQGATHEIKDVKVISKSKKQELDMVVKNINKEVNACQDDVQNLKDVQKIIQTNLVSEIQCIDQISEEIIAAILKERDALKAELHNQGEIKLDKMRREVDRVEKRADRLEVATDVAGQTLKSSDYAYITQHVSLVNQMRTLRVEEEVPHISETQYAGKFVQNIVSGVKLGRVVRQRKLELVQEIGGFNDADQLAGSPDAVLAVTDTNSKEVMVYHKQNGQYIRQLSLSLPSSNTYQPSGVAVCTDGKFLVARHTGIEMYSTTGEFQVMAIEADETIMDRCASNVWSVVTMANGRILVGDVAQCTIGEYESTGNFLQQMTIRLKPYHIVPTKDTNIAVCDVVSNKVSVIDMELRDEMLSIDIPRVQDICYDTQTECMLIVRNEPHSEPGRVCLNTGVIEQYCCTTGGLVACLAQGLYFPQGVALMSDGNLAVADRKSVKIYKMF